MARVTPPVPYVSWNAYIKDNTDYITDPVARKLAKRNIKLDLIASVERYANDDPTSPSYREYNIYEHPGTVSPTPHRPWQSEATDSLAQLLLESGEYLGTEDLRELTAE
jgi:hypothetical protein